MLLPPAFGHILICSIDEKDGIPVVISNDTDLALKEIVERTEKYGMSDITFDRLLSKAISNVDLIQEKRDSYKLPSLTWSLSSAA